jgi:DNA-binding winged helix-turn-helix (wHTH) protein
MAAALAHTVLGFGPYALDLAGERLLHRGEPVHLTPKAFALLGLLASRPGQLVTKREIFDALWPSTHVTDFALSRCVRELRVTLGDDAHTPRFLATVHRRGFRFVAEVTRPDPAAGPETPFVGRERELAAARGWLAERSHGPIRLLRISGEPGVGKTRLARELAEHARAAGVLVLWSQTPGGEGAPPYDVWRQVFDAQRAQVGAERARGAPARAAIEPRDGRQRAFATVVERLSALTAQRPALLVLDDLHGADPDSLHLLDHLLQDVENPRLAIVCTLRDVGAPPNDLLRATLEAAGGAGRVALALRGLAPAESAALLAARVGGERARRFAAHVHERSGGNPLYVAQLAELVPRDDETSIFRTDLSGTLRGLIASRLALVSPLCADVLTAAAVLGSEAPLAMLREVAEVGADALAEGAQEAVAQRLLAPEDLAGHLRFTHGLVREVVYERAKPGARARLHRRAARALEQGAATGAGERLSALAHHFGRAVLGGDTGKAIHYAMRAGERALALYAFEDAAAHFDAALDALEAEDPLDASRACRAAIAAARTHGLCGRGELAVGLAARAVEFARKSRSARAFREAAVVASELQPSYARDPRSIALIDEALAGAGDRDLATRAQLVSLRAMMAFLDADRPAHERGSREALELARRSADPPALLEALRVRGFALNQPESEREWRACIEERIALAAAHGDALHDFGARQQRVELCIQTGDPAGVQEDLRAMTEIAERVRSPKMAATLACTHAGLAIAAGPLAEARRQAERGFAIGRRVDFGEWWAIAQLQLGAIGVAEEQPPADLAREIRRGTVSHAQVSLFRAGEIHLLCLDGDEQEARRRLLSLARDGFAGLRRDISFSITLANLSQSCAALRMREAAEPLVELLRPYAGRSLTLMSVYSAGCASRFLGTNLSCLARWKEADAAFATALAVDRANGARAWEAQTLVDWARSLRERGGAACAKRARALLREALPLAEALGLRRLAREVRALLAAAGP